MRRIMVVNNNIPALKLRIPLRRKDRARQDITPRLARTRRRSSMRPRAIRTEITSYRRASCTCRGRGVGAGRVSLAAISFKQKEANVFLTIILVFNRYSLSSRKCPTRGDGARDALCSRLSSVAFCVCIRLELAWPRLRAVPGSVPGEAKVEITQTRLVKVDEARSLELDAERNHEHEYGHEWAERDTRPRAHDVLPVLPPPGERRARPQSGDDEHEHGQHGRRRRARACVSDTAWVDGVAPRAWVGRRTHACARTREHRAVPADVACDASVRAGLRRPTVNRRPGCSGERAEVGECDIPGAPRGAACALERSTLGGRLTCAG